MGTYEGWGLGEGERVADMMALYGLLLVRAARKRGIALGGCSIRCTGVGCISGNNAVLGDSGLTKHFIVLHYAGARSSQVVTACTACRLH